MIFNFVLPDLVLGFACPNLLIRRNGFFFPKDHTGGVLGSFLFVNFFFISLTYLLASSSLDYYVCLCSAIDLNYYFFFIAKHFSYNIVNCPY